MHQPYFSLVKKRVVLFVAIALVLQCRGNAQTGFRIPGNVKQIVFLGNSITYAGLYVSYIEAYLTARYPEKQIAFLNLGLPSETVSGLSEPRHAGGQFPRPDLRERLSRVLTQTKPDLVFACYGMNDGIYMPFDDTRFQKFRDGMNWLDEQLSKAGVPIVYLTPPVYDQRCGESYANVLDIYADWLISCRYTKNWNVVDVHWPMKKYLEDKRISDSTFRFAEDCIHPDETGHWIMAQQVLLYLGEDVSKAESIKEAMLPFTKGDSIVSLVEIRQEMMRDAWLTSTGYKRPGLKRGLPFREAQQKAGVLEKKIRALVQ